MGHPGHVSRPTVTHYLSDRPAAVRRADSPTGWSGSPTRFPGGPDGEDLDTGDEPDESCGSGEEKEFPDLVLEIALNSGGVSKL